MHETSLLVCGMRCRVISPANTHTFIGPRLQRMHEMQTIVIDVRGVCMSVCRHSFAQLCVCGAFRAAFAKSLSLLVFL